MQKHQNTLDNYKAYQALLKKQRIYRRMQWALFCTMLFVVALFALLLLNIAFVETFLKIDVSKWLW
ncbi:hypothetical protein [Mesonia sp. HuA40]|uniref:hypothetical protein n=1 Tax=Mesonia sp. HuA40 TaxID=2602761 RepID=UPI0011C7B834|nr:hypothetical protein [Mesonia sp. HuA40]TXK73919.1 hypothetical protein FT993_03410 [Mesonia sp. HuA40]